MNEMDDMTPMFQSTMDLLKESKGQFRVIAADTGLDYNWLHKLSQGEIKDPSVRKIERLHGYLTSEHRAA
jgi:hypothetical protein